MYDAFGSSPPGSAQGHRRFKRPTTPIQIPASYGVRAGFIKDPNWPPVRFPHQGTAMQRRSRRLNCNFQVRFGTTELDVAGNLSSGGAAFTCDSNLGLSELDIVVVREGYEYRARARLLSASSKAAPGSRERRISHHVQFLNPAEGAQVWRAVCSNLLG